MAAENPKITITLTDESGAQFDTAGVAGAGISYTGDTVLKGVLTGTGANQEFDRSWLNSKVVFLWFKSNVTATVYSNHASGSSPDNTLPLTAGVPVIYPFAANPFVTADVTKLFITGTNFSIDFYVLLNA